MDHEAIDLDGIWEFRFGAPDAPAREIAVPGPWQAQFDDLRTRAGVGWYRRTVELPAGWGRGRRAILRFGAAFHFAEVEVNGALVGAHEGGFLPFAFDVTDQLRRGGAPNGIRVRVEGPADVPGAGGLAELPFGKQSWYGPLTGLWQSVRLEARDAEHLAGFRLRPDPATGEVAVELRLARPAAEPLEATLEVREGAGGGARGAESGGPRAAGLTLVIPTGGHGVEGRLRVPAARRWSPDAPHLYRLVASLRRDGLPVDRETKTFGFRSIETRDGRVLLNGEPFYLRGALDQDYYPDGICTVPSLAFLEDQLRKAKELGLNCLRCHIKVPDPRYYEVADRLGMLVWTELPNAARTTPASRARAEALLRGILERDGHHPSIGIWTVVNENWGTDLVHDAEHRAWLKRTVDWLKAADPTRLVVDNSPLAPSHHVKTDIADFHYYAAIPDHRDEWDRFVDGLASRPGWLFSPHGDAVTDGSEPLMCSEFGNWGLPHPADLAGPDGREPWWFETGHDWGEGVMYAHGVERRFADWSLGRAFGSFRGFVEAAQWQQFRALKYQIEAMRRHAAIAGYVITEFTDCHWESNGLLDMRRNPRVFHEALKTVNADTVVVPRWERLAVRTGEAVRLELAVAHGAGAPLEGAVLEATLADGVTLPVPAVEAGGVARLGTVELEVPAGLAPGVHRLRLELRDAGGRIVASNHLDLAVHGARPAPAADGPPVWSPDADLRWYLAALGHRVAPGLADARLAVARASDPALQAFVREGGALLLLPEAEMALQPYFPHWQNLQVRNRDGTMWRGDWASSFAWISREPGGPFADLPGFGPLLDEAFDRVIPTHVIGGCNPLDFQGRVHAGLVVGWVHKPVALAVERGYGRGRLVVSTFRLFRDPPGADPTATALLDRLVALARGEPAPAHAAAAPATLVEPVG